MLLVLMLWLLLLLPMMPEMPLPLVTVMSEVDDVLEEREGVRRKMSTSPAFISRYDSS